MVNYGGNLDSVEKCQFKGIWKNGKTTTIRVPINLAEKILDYAHKLDQGELEEEKMRSQLLRILDKHKQGVTGYKVRSIVFKDIEKILGGTKNEIT